MGAGTTAVETAVVKSVLYADIGGTITPPVQFPRVRVLSVTESVTEGTTARFRIVRDGLLTVPCGVYYVPVQPSGSLPGFVTPINPVFAQFLANQTEIFVDVPTISAPGVQGSRIGQLMLYEPLGCIIADHGDMASVTINDSTVSILSVSVTPTSIVEGNTGNKMVRFIFDRGGNTVGVCSCPWVRTGTINNADLVTNYAISGTVSFNSGVTIQNLDFFIAGDLEVEGTDTITVGLTASGAINCVVGTPSSATCTVTNDDVPVVGQAILNITALDTTIDEGETGDLTNATFYIDRTGELNVIAGARWVRSGTIADSDLQSPVGSETFTMAIGVNRKTVTHSVKGNNGVNVDKTLIMTLDTPNASTTLGTNKSVTVTVIDDDTAPVSGIPNPLRTITVSTKTELQNLLSQSDGPIPNTVEVVGNDRNGPVRPGDHVILATGTDWGGSTYTPGSAIIGNSSNPIFFRSPSNANRTQCDSDWVFNKAYLGLAYMNVSGGGERVSIYAKGSRIHRMYYTGQSSGQSIIALKSTGKWGDARIDRNTFENFTGAAIEGTLEDVANNKNCMVERNYFNGHTAFGGQESVCIFLQDEFEDIDVTYLENLFNNCMTASKEGEIVSIKTAGALFKGNTMQNCQSKYISLRASARSRVEANFFCDGTHLRVHGDDHVVINNWDEDDKTSSGFIRLYWGNSYANNNQPYPPAVWPNTPQCNVHGLRGQGTLIQKASSCNGTHNGARRTYLENNNGTINVGEVAGGDEYKSSPVRDVTGTKNKRALVVKNAAGYVGTVPTITGGNNTKVANKLSATEVGYLS